MLEVDAILLRSGRGDVRAAITPSFILERTVVLLMFARATRA